MAVGGSAEWVGVARDKDDGCIPLFHMHAHHMKRASEREGRPIYEQRQFVKILIPGQKNEVPDREVTDEDKARWPEAWAKFTAKQEAILDGTPIDQWPYLNVARVAELQALNILTVEQLSKVADGYLQNIGMDGAQLRDRARQFIAGTSETEKELRTENERLQRDVAALTRKVDVLLHRVGEKDETPAPAPASRKGGRKKR
jgi:hypothetical protein